MSDLGFESRVATTEQVRSIAKVASNRRYNRQLHTDYVQQLEPTGFHVLKPVTIHEHVNGELVAPHMRVAGLFKLKGTMTPAEVTIDVPMEIWNVLWRKEQVEKAMNELLEAAERQGA